MTDWRVICLVSVLMKLYEGVLFDRLTRCFLRPLHHGIVGFRPKHSTSDVTDFLRLTAGKAVEWKQPLWAMSLDIKGAFDNMTIGLCTRELLRAGAPWSLTTAWAREQIWGHPAPKSRWRGRPSIRHGERHQTRH